MTDLERIPRLLDDLASAEAKLARPSGSSRAWAIRAVTLPRNPACAIRVS